MSHQARKRNDQQVYARLDMPDRDEQVVASVLKKPISLSLRNKLNRITSIFSGVVFLIAGIVPLNADPAPNAANFSLTAAGAISATVPDGTCAAIITASGANGGSSSAGGVTGGFGGGGAIITSRFAVLPLQAVGGAVGQGGQLPNGGTGYSTGGVGGTAPGHRGAGGGGSTGVTLAGVPLVIAAAGGGGGAAHNAPPASHGGDGGFAGIGAGVAAPGSNGSNGVDGTRTVGGGQGGQAAVPGTGGVLTPDTTPSRSGFAGVGGNGGNGGNDANFDSGGGGGGGFFGGGGGASTANESVSGAGGGGGSSFVRANSPTSAATVPTLISGSARAKNAAGSRVGLNGSVLIDWVPCRYQLAVSKSANPNTVRAGDAAIWTVTVINNGPDPMTRGDTLTLADTLPPGPNGANSPAYRVLSVATSGGVDANLDSTAFTCSGVAVGSAMPTSTTCTRPYAASTSPGAPSGGSRGLNVGETLTITYQQVISNTAACSTITNRASTVDRANLTGTTDIIGANSSPFVDAPLNIQCYDLGINKSVNPSAPNNNDVLTWSVVVTNNGVADMEGPVDTAANPLIVTDVAPASDVSAPTGFTSTGPAGACTYSAGTITCPSSLPAGQSQTFTFTQTVNATALGGSTITNSASVTDPAVSDSNDSSATTATVAALPSIGLVKTAGVITDIDSNGPDAGDTVSYTFSVTNNGNVALTNVQVNDPLVTVTGGPIASLAPSTTNSTTFTASYTLTQADVDTGGVNNQATASGAPPTGPVVTDLSDSLTSGSGAGNDDATFIAIPFNPAITVDKTSPTPSFDSVGDVLTYSYLVRNSGNVTLLSAISVTDDKATVTCPALPVGGLAPNGTITCSASSIATQADIDFGSVVNIASAATTFGAGNTPVNSPTDQVTVPAVQSPSMSILKNATAVNFINIGDTVSYEYIVTNTGNTTLTNAITITDNRVTPVNCPALPGGGLAPGATHTCTATYSVLLEDLDIGSVTNLAFATSGPTTSPQTSETIPSGSNPALSISKSSTATSFNILGDVVPYSFLVSNSGNATFTRTINVVDDKIGTIACWAPVAGDLTFTPAETVICTGNYTVTQADLDRGFVTNQASAATTYGLANIPVTSPPDGVTVNAIQNPSLNVTKGATTLPVSAVGQVLTYTVTAQNNGDVTLSNVTITDPLIPAMSCTVASLAVGTSTNCVATYTATQADFDAGQIANTAKADGVTPQGAPVTDTGSNTVLITQVVSVSIGKVLSSNTDEDRSTDVSLNDTLNYAITVTNDGNVTQNNVVVTDALLSPSTRTCATVAPGGTCVLTGTLSVTQARVDAGAVNNAATVTTTLLPTAETATSSVPVPQVSSIGFDKQAPTNGDQDGSGNVTVNDVLTYTVIATNTGNVTQNTVMISDPLISPSTEICASVAPGGTCILIGTKTVTQAEVNAGSILNTASSTSALVTTPLTDSVTVNIDRSPAITVVKSAGPVTDLDGNDADVGDTIAYSFVVRNKGNVTLTSVGVTDAKVGAVSCPVTALDPGASTTCSATYVLTLLDLNASQVTNTAEASGTPPSGAAVKDVSGATETDNIPTVKTFTGRALIAVVKSAGAIVDIDLNGEDVGDTIDYTFIVSNEGSVTLSSIGVIDPKVGAVTCSVTSLDPGASTICTATYALVLADLNAGGVTNTATASGTPPSGPVVRDTSGNAVGDDTPTVTPILQSPAVAVTKSAAPITDIDINGPDVGDTIAYTFNVSNTGNVTLTSVGISDPKVGPVLCATSSLAPATSTTCSATYVLTQADVDAGQVQNSAIASGTPPTGPAVADTSGTGVGDNTPTVSTITQTPSLAVVKTSPTTSFDSVGDVLTYSYVVRNSGNVTITNPVTINDDKTTVSCPALPSGGLAPQSTLACTATYSVVQADIDAGSVVNTASAATTFGPGNTAVTSPTDNATVPAVQTPSMSILKNATAVAFINIGDTVSYEYIVTNTGNTTLTDAISITDNRVTPVNCPTLPVGGLAPGAIHTCTADYFVLVEDLDIGSVTNLAFATSGPTTSPQTSETIPSGSTPALSISKSSTATSFNILGDIVPYSFLVSNSGNATFTRTINVVDDKIGTIACWTPVVADPTFVPTETITCTGNYTVTQADLDRGYVTNQASAATTYGLANIPVTSPPDALTVNAVQNPELTVSKSVTTLPVTAVNQVLTYTVTVENTGDVTLTNVTTSDPLIPSMSCTVASMAPGAISNCVGTYTVSQVDFDAGSIVNTALSTASTPQGAPVSDTGGNTVTITQTPAVAVVKRAGSIVDLDGNGPDLGDEIGYSFEVSNEGDVTLSAITVADLKVGTVNCPVASIAPGLSIICSATYFLTLADVNAGEVVNTADVTAQPPLGGTVSDASGSAVGNDTPTTKSIPSNPLIALIKNASPIRDLDGNGADVGDMIDYTFIVSNQGNQTLTNLTITDAKVSVTPCVITTLAPGESTNCAATYTLLQSDVDAGLVSNTAIATALDPRDAPITDTSGTGTGNNTPTVSIIPRTSSMNVLKYAGALTDTDGNGDDVGDRLTYTFAIGNTGNQTLTGITLSDVKATVLGGPLATLAPATTDSSTFTATYILTQADVDAGNVTNTAIVRGNPPTGPPVGDTSGTSTTNDVPTDTLVRRAPALTLVKTATGINVGANNRPDAGDSVSYNFDVVNSGNVTLTNIAINDPLVGMAALERANDIYTLVAMAVTGVDPMATASTSRLVDTETNSDKKSLTTLFSEIMFGPADVPTIRSAIHVQRKLVRLSNRTGEMIAGENLGIYFTLTNTGDGVLTSIAATQDGAEGLGSDLDMLAPNTSDALPMVFAYTVTEADIAAGYLEKSGRIVARSRTEVLETIVSQKLSLADVDSPNELLVGSILPASIPSLAPGANTRFTGTYILTQADIDAGTLSNRATATGTSPGGGSVSDASGTLSTNDLSTDIVVPRAPAVAIVKLASAISDEDGNGPDVGDTIAYTFDVSNEGNVTLSGIAITDVKIGAVNCPQTTIAPAITVRCNATYTLTQADVDAGSVTNTADVLATAPGGATVRDKSGSAIGNDTQTVTTIQRNGSMTLVKLAAAPTIAAGLNAAVSDAEDTIEYSFTVKNTGNVTLTSIAVTDNKAPSIICPVNSLLPTQSTICLGTYELTLADFDEGSVENKALATGTEPDGSQSSDVSGTDETNDTPTISTLPQTPALTLTKMAAAPTTSSGASATLVDVGDKLVVDDGDSIVYTFTVANTGNVSLTGIDVTDAKLPTVTCATTALAPGASTTCTGTYAITQIDLDAGTVQNTALVAGNAPNGTPTDDTSGTDETNNTPTDTALPQVALIAVVKTASPFNDIDGNGVDVDDTIAYTFAVTNQGNVTLNTIIVDDDKVDAVVCPVTTLAPTETTNCTATYVLIQDDIDRGQVENQATASGTPPLGSPVTDLSDPTTPGQGPGENDKTITNLEQTAAITLVKLADISGLTTPAPQPGEKIIYIFTVKNTGNVSLTDITLADPLPNLVIDPTIKILKLLPGNSDSTTFRAEYTVTDDDISGGRVENGAVVTGNYADRQLAPQTTMDTSGSAENNNDRTIVPLLAQPGISLIKREEFNDITAPFTGANLGDTITYTFVVRNTGNVEVTDINVVDPLFDNPNAINCNPDVLQVGQQVECNTVIYNLTQADINTGSVTNRAVASANAIVRGERLGVSDRSGTAGGNDDPTITTFPIPRPTFTKTVNNSTAKIGDTLTFTLKATTVVVTPIDIVDQLPGGLTFIKGSATINSLAATPIVSGRTITFADIAIPQAGPEAGEVIITLQAIVNASAKDGKMTNIARLLHNNGTLLATARANVDIRPEPVFDCGDIIGKVFDDRNHNGLQDAGTSSSEPERGIPNVRVATVNGTLITTDKHGRFHIPCADIPNKKIGTNFILKLDPRSLPSGYRMTTENPKVVRLTRGKLSKVNFGATISRVIRLDLTDTVFTAGGLSVSPKLKAAVGKLVGILDEEQSTVRLQYHIGAEGKAIAGRRLKLIEDYIAAQWAHQSGRYKLPIETRLVHKDKKASN